MYVCILFSLLGNNIHSDDYYLGYFKNANGDNNVSVSLITTESQPVSYIVEAPRVPYYHNGRLMATHETTVNLPDSVIVTKYANDQYHGIHVNVQSDRVTVIGQTVGEFNSDTFLALPLTDVANDTEFIYYGMSVGRIKAAFYSIVLIVGTANNTTIKLKVTQSVKLNRTLKLVPDMEYTFVVNKLQTFLIRSLNDLSGTKIIANKQISMFSGHEAGNAIKDPSHTDHLIEQIPSINFWGTKYYTVPFVTTSYTIKVLAAYNFTKVTIHCNHTMEESFTISEGEFKNFSSYHQEYCAIHASKKILVVQFSHKGRDNDIGEPLMVLVPATIQYLNKLDFSTIRNSNNHSHYINVIVMAQYYQPKMIYLRTGELNMSLEAHNWVPIVVDNITESYATRINISEGTSQIVHANSSALMTAIVYGFAEQNGYGHPAGLKLIG